MRFLPFVAALKLLKGAILEEAYGKGINDISIYNAKLLLSVANLLEDLRKAG